MARDTLGQSDEHNSRGIELADRGWFDEAIKEFKKAIELDPNSAHAHDNLATVYAEKKQFREALAAYLTALRLEPDSATVHYNLGVFLSTFGNEFAVAEYQEAIALEPDYPDAHLSLGLAHADGGRLDEAMKELRVAIDLDPSDPVARHELASLLMDLDDYRNAITHLKEVTRLDPKLFEAWLDLGICYAQKGFYAEAERAYDKAAELEKGDVLLLYNQAALYALWGRPADALSLLTRAVAADKAKVQDWLRTDPMFDSLKGQPEFEALR
ncbi:MAG: tetratricopeptide repeat protein [Myxococcaceae bacterium]|nr:tetratricopeptide repeat protein [Myxococcaceae bacterium]